MKRNWTLLLALAAFAIAASLTWWLMARTSWHPPSPIKPALPDIAVQTGFEGAIVKSALQKPLLWSSRAPVEERDEAGESAPKSEIDQFQLVAVLESGGQRVALLQRPDRSVLKIDSAAPEGDWQLDSFDGAVAVFVSNAGQRVERPLERTAAAPSPGPSQPGGRTSRPDRNMSVSQPGPRATKVDGGQQANLTAPAGPPVRGPASSSSSSSASPEIAAPLLRRR